jgi:hypothetical protein
LPKITQNFSFLQEGLKIFVAFVSNTRSFLEPALPHAPGTPEMGNGSKPMKILMEE